jgi:hypothetical protein
MLPLRVSIAQAVMLLVLMGSTSIGYSYSASPAKQSMLLQDNPINRFLAKTLYIRLQSNNGVKAAVGDLFITARPYYDHNFLLQLCIYDSYSPREWTVVGYRYLWKGRKPSKDWFVGVKGPKPSKDWFVGVNGLFSWQAPWTHSKRYGLRSWAILGEFATSDLQLGLTWQKNKDDILYTLSVSIYVWHAMSRFGRVNPFVLFHSDPLFLQRLRPKIVGLGLRWELPLCFTLGTGLIWNIEIPNWLFKPRPTIYLSINLAGKDPTATYARHRFLEKSLCT